MNRAGRGTYYCTAHNDFSENCQGSGVTRSIIVNVEFPPEVIVGRPRYGQALDYDIDLECKVTGYPVPNITWVKDEQVLTNDSKYK